MELIPLQMEMCEEVYELAKSRIPEHWSLQGVKDILKYDNNIYYVVRLLSTGKVIAFGGIMVIADEAELLNIAVEEEYSRMGIADELMLQLIKVAKMQQTYRMLLEVRESNTAAQRLYQKHGFRKLGERKDYYSNPKENAFIMEHVF